jgi:ABC-type dipeptide/oligopeptide/nickel transport system permease subunit
VSLILIFVVIAVAAPLIAPLDPEDPEVFMRVGRPTEGSPQPPSEEAILGMLPFGVDIFHPLVWGARDALQFGLIVTLSTALFGVLYGAVAGFAGNALGTLMIRMSDSFLAVPPIAGLVFLQQLFTTTIGFMGGLNFYSPFFPQTIDPESPPLIFSILDRVNPLMLSLIIFSWMPFARLVHSIVLTLRQTDFVQAARALGGGPIWIIRKHILRNSIGPAIVLAARDVGGVVLLQATLTFVQIGGDSIWGQMLSQGRNWVIGPGGSLMRYWWVWLPPTIAVMAFGIAWNMFGDGLNDVLEPGSQQRFGRRPFWRRRDQADAPEPVVEALPEVAPVALSLNSPLTVGSISTAPPQEVVMTNGADPILVTARDYLSRGDLPQALHGYGFLIQRGRSMDEVLPDLARLAKSHPRDPQVWQTLGDALRRAGRLEQANQSYQRADKLRQ